MTKKLKIKCDIIRCDCETMCPMYYINFVCPFCKKEARFYFCEFIGDCNFPINLKRQDRPLMNILTREPFCKCNFKKIEIKKIDDYHNEILELEQE